jgi:hypothetical protein
MEISLPNPIFNNYNIFFNKATKLKGDFPDKEIDDINEFFSIPLNFKLPPDFTFITINEFKETDLIIRLRQNFYEYQKIYKYTEFKDFCQEIIFEIESYIKCDWIYETELNQQNIFYDFVFYSCCFSFAYDEKYYLSSMLFDKKNTYEYLFKVKEWINNIFKHELNDSETLITPFIDDETEKIFNFLVTNWKYNKELRYAYIYNFLTDELGLKIDFTDYQRFILKNYNILRVHRGQAISSPKDQLPLIYKSYLDK